MYEDTVRPKRVLEDHVTPYMVQKEPELVPSLEVEYFQTEDESTGIWNIFGKDEEDIPVHNTSSFGGTRTLSQDMVLSSLEIVGTNMSAYSLASMKYPLKFLCKY